MHQIDMRHLATDDPGLFQPKKLPVAAASLRPVCRLSAPLAADYHRDPFHHLQAIAYAATASVFLPAPVFSLLAGSGPAAGTSDPDRPHQPPYFAQLAALNSQQNLKIPVGSDSRLDL